MEAILRCVDTSSLCGRQTYRIGLGKNLSSRIMQSQCIQARGIRPATRGSTIGVGSQGRQGHRLRALTSERTHADPAAPTGIAAGEVAQLAIGYP